MSTQVSRRVTSRALEQRDMASLRVTEVWTDVVISFTAPSAVSILLETPVKLAFVRGLNDENETRNECNECNECNEENEENRESYWTRDASIVDVTLAGIVADDIAPVDGTWRTYLDLVPFKDFVTDLRAHLARVNCKIGKEGNDPARCNVGNWRFYNIDGVTSYAMDLPFKAATAMFINLNTKLPIRNAYDTEYAFNEFYYLVASTIATVEAYDKAREVSSGGFKTSLFGVPIEPRVFASTYSYSTSNYHFMAGYRQLADVRAWLMRNLFTGQPIAGKGNDTTAVAAALSVSLPPGLPSAFWHDFVGRLSRLSRLSKNRDSSKKKRVGVYLARIVETAVEKEKEKEKGMDPTRADWLAATSTTSATAGTVATAGTAATVASTASPATIVPEVGDGPMFHAVIPLLTYPNCHPKHTPTFLTTHTHGAGS